MAAGINGTDAVNMNQLNAGLAGVNARIDGAYAQIDGLRNDLDELEEAAFSGIAAVAATAPLMPPAPGLTTVNIGCATYGGESAVGVSAAHLFSSGVVVSGGISMQGSTHTLGRIGIGFTF